MKMPVDFGLLLFEEADELVVLLDGFEGFDVRPSVRRTRSVDDTETRRFCSALTGMTKRSPRW